MLHKKTLSVWNIKDAHTYRQKDTQAERQGHRKTGRDTDTHTDKLFFVHLDLFIWQTLLSRATYK